jgi:hypothetical protein
LPEKTENSNHSKNSGYKINRGPHNNFSTTNTSNRWKLFSDGRCNFSSHHGTLRPPQNMPVITPSNKNSHPNSNYSAGFFFFFSMAAAPRRPPYTNHYKQASNHRTSWPTSQNTKTQTKSFFFLTGRAGHHAKKKRSSKVLPMWALCPQGSAATKKTLNNTNRVKKKLLYHVVVCMNGLDIKGGDY